MSSASRVVLLGLAMFLSLAIDARAEDAWNPFKQKDVRERTGLAKERADRQLPPGEHNDAARRRAPALDASSASVERGDVAELAARGRLSGDFLHRLATVLDALDFQVPIALWDAANRTPQPATGHLPETGVLSQLQDAARKKEVARTALLAMRTLGPEGTDGAHLIALGDTTKALKRAGFAGEAHGLGFEALFGSWPRTQTH